MPRFYFDFHDGRQRHADEIGCDLPDLRAAQSIALQSVRELRDQDGSGRNSFSRCGFIIENESHEVLAVVSFDDA